MMQICKFCERVIRQDDEVKAVVIARFIEMGATAAYSLQKPSECLEITHRNCQHPQGAPDGD